MAFALIGDGDAGQRQIDVFGLQRRNDAAEVHRFQGVVQLQLFGDGGPQVDVEADVFVALFELKGTKAVSVATTSLSAAWELTAKARESAARETLKIDFMRGIPVQVADYPFLYCSWCHEKSCHVFNYYKTNS